MEIHVGSNQVISNTGFESPHGDSFPVFDQMGELPLLPFGNPIGFVPASRGGVYIKSNYMDRGF